MKIKIFVFDGLCLGLKDCHRYLNGQIYRFPWKAPGYGLFKGSRGICLIKGDCWGGAWGEIWEVTPGAFERISTRMADLGMIPERIYEPGLASLDTWITKRQKGAKLIKISDVRSG